MQDPRQYERMIEALAARIGLLKITKQNLIFLCRAAEYADIENYVETPKTMQEVVKKQIFWAKAQGYWQRKMVELLPGKLQDVCRILNWENREVFELKKLLQ